MMAALFCGWVLLPPLGIPIGLSLQDWFLLLRHELKTWTWTDIIDLPDPSTTFAINMVDSISLALADVVAAAYSVILLEVLISGNLMARTVKGNRQ